MAKTNFFLLLLMIIFTVSSAVFALYESTFTYIRSLANIQYVVLVDIDGKNAIQLYGTVTVQDSYNNHIVYNRSLGNSESKGPGETASLIPNTVISGEDAVIISVSLWDHNKDHDNEIANGEFEWDPRGQYPIYDMTLEEEVSGKSGKVIVGYCVIRNALNAEIQVDIDIHGPSQIYGLILASYHMGTSGATQLQVLFNKEAFESINVSRPQAIPLDLSTFPVPWDSNLTLEVALKISKSGLLEEQNLSGSENFAPKIRFQAKNITSEVRVFITWS